MREALETWKGPKDEVLVATKVGHFRNFTDGRPTWDVDGRPENLIRRGKESALALGVDTIDLLYFHRPDPKVPYNESVEAIKQLVDEGVAQEAGISNASIEQIDIARGILGDKLVAVQNQYSPIHLETQDTLDYCAKVGLAFVCWSPLGGYRHPYDELPAGRAGMGARQGRPHVRDSRRAPSRNHPRLPEGRPARTHPRRTRQARLNFLSSPCQGSCLA